MAIDTSKILAATVNQPKSTKGKGESKGGDAKAEAGQKAAAQEGAQQTTTVKPKGVTNQAASDAVNAAISVPGTGFHSANPSIAKSNTETLQPELASSSAAISRNFPNIKQAPTGPTQDPWINNAGSLGGNSFPQPQATGPIAIAQAQVVQTSPPSSAPIQQTFVEAPSAPEQTSIQETSSNEGKGNQEFGGK